MTNATKAITKDSVPKTLICRINGSVLLDNNLMPFEKDVISICENHERVILKPSIDSSSGQGIIVFELKGDKYSNGQFFLTKEFLLNYGNNFVLQEIIEQHPDLALFNETSLNTLRIATYRSVKDEKVHVLSAILRIGKKGSNVDNAHAGGRYVGINVENGHLGNYICDQFGQKSVEWNGISFHTGSFRIPCWKDVVIFAKKVAQKVYHHRLLALDITVNTEGKPILIEYNIGGFSYWLFEFTNQKPLGEFTDEIIDYCRC